MGVHVTFMWLAAFQVSFQCFDVTMWYFEEILLSIFNVAMSYLSVTSYVAAVGRNSCGAAEAPERQL